jgi:uncharacterized coiled-coil DUF342 family protein
VTDSEEIDRLRAELAECREALLTSGHETFAADAEIDRLRAELAERDQRLSASAWREAQTQAAWLVEINKVARVREVLTYPDEQGYDFSCFYYDVRAAIEGNQP